MHPERISAMMKILESNAVEKLARDVEKSTRSTREGVKNSIEPAPGTLARAKYKRHHIGFGRRGRESRACSRKSQQT